MVKKLSRALAWIPRTSVVYTVCRYHYYIGEVISKSPLARSVNADDSMYIYIYIICIYIYIIYIYNMLKGPTRNNLSILTCC